MVDVNCKICGDSFYTSPGHIKKSWGKYCSQNCKNKAFTGSGNPRWMGGLNVRQCQTCGIFFNCKPSHIKIGEGKYCSRKCFLETLNRKEKRICTNCGKEFMAFQCHIKRGGGLSCSVECSRENNKKNTSNQIRQFGVMNIFGGGKGGKRKDLDNKYFRSSWEANYARYLNFLIRLDVITKWEYESETFEFPIKKGSKFYTPDFKLTYSNGVIEYHEIKGYMDQKSYTKIRRMEKYYPNISLILIDGKQYRKLKKEFGRSILNWE